MGEGDLVLFTDWQGDAHQRLGEGEETELLRVLGARPGPGRDGARASSGAPTATRPASSTRRTATWASSCGTAASRWCSTCACGSGAPTTRSSSWSGGRTARRRRRLRRRHRPRPQPARRPPPPRRPAGPRHRAGVRRARGVARRPAAPARPGRPRRGDRLPRALGGPVAAVAARVAPRLLDTWRAVRSQPDHAARAAARPARPARARSSCCGPIPRSAAADLPFAPRGERSVARGYLKALANARELIYVEDQYFWHHEAAESLADVLADRPDAAAGRRRAARPRRRGDQPGAQLLARDRALDALDCAPRRAAWRRTGSRTTAACPSTSTPRRPSSTTGGSRSGPTTSTAAPGPTTPS